MNYELQLFGGRGAGSGAGGSAGLGTYKGEKTITGASVVSFFRNLNGKGLNLDAADQNAITKNPRSMNDEKVKLYDAQGNEYTATFNRYWDGGVEVVNIKKTANGAKIKTEKGWTGFRPGETAFNVMNNNSKGDRVQLYEPATGKSAIYERTESVDERGRVEGRWKKVSGNINNDYLGNSFGTSQAAVINNTQGLQAKAIAPKNKSNESSAVKAAKAANKAVDKSNASSAKRIASPSVMNKMSASGKRGLLDAAGVGSRITVESRGIDRTTAKNTLQKQRDGRWEVVDGPRNSAAHFDERFVKADSIAYGTTVTNVDFK